MDALDLACREPDKIVVYPAVGFEATAPSVAETILSAAQRGLDNFCVVPSIRLLPPTIDLLMHDTELNIQGLLSSDHFNTISDTEAYTVITKRHQIPCCLAGFEPTEILEGLVSLVRQIINGQSFFDDSSAFIYSSREAIQAREMVAEVFFLSILHGEAWEPSKKVVLSSAMNFPSMMRPKDLTSVFPKVRKRAGVSAMPLFPDGGCLQTAQLSAWPVRHKPYRSLHDLEGGYLLFIL